MSLAAGSHIGPYEILSALGAGGMGEVYRARDTRLKRDVAIKLLPETFASDAARMARFKREAEVLASLNHPNIATLYGLEGDTLVMELVEGEPPQGPMPFDDAWNLVSQIAAALAFAHERGIVHRDLKPANLKVTGDGVVKLLDFGLAKALTEETSQSANPEHSPTLTLGATQLGVILGTAAYMSPEQAKGKNVDRRADVWAFGVVFYELLTGQRLFKGEDIAETLAQVLTREPDLSRVPVRARKLLRRCLEKDPKKRLKDIGEAQYYIDDVAAAAPPRRRIILPWVIAAGALSLSSGAYWLRPAREQPVIRSVISPPEQSIYRCQGDDAGPAVLSPDGKRLAFTAVQRAGKVTLWVRALDSVSGQSLAGTDGATFPFWAANSQAVGFFADGKLKKIELASGIVSAIADAPINRGGAWNSEDIIVFAPNLTSVLMRVSASGGAVSPVTRLDESQHEMSHRWPSFLPDGKHYLYTSRDKGVFVASLEGAEQPRRILGESTNALYREGHLLYGRGNTLLARPFDAGRRQFTGSAMTLTQVMQSELLSDRACFSASDNGLLAYHAAWGTYQLTWADRAGNRLGTLGEPGLFQGVEISPDGKRVAAAVSDGVTARSVWIYDVDRGIRTRFSSVNNAKYLGVVWSADSRRLAVALQRDGRYEIYAKELGERGQEDLLFRSNFELNLNQWLPNGGMMLVLRDPKTDWDVVYLPPPLKGVRPPPVPILQSEASESGGILSPDGRWVLYESNESGSDVFEAYVAAFPSGGHRRQVSSGGVDQTSARWTPTGEILFANHMKLMSASARRVGDALEIAPPRVLFETSMDCNSFELSCFDVTLDGKRILLLQATGPPPAVELVQHWTAALNK